MWTFIHKHLSRKTFPLSPRSTFKCHFLTSEEDIAASQHLVLVTRQAHVPQNKQQHCIDPSTHTRPSEERLMLAILEKSIDKDRTTLTVHIHNFENTLQQWTHIYDPPNAHEHKLDPVIHYILHSGSKKKRWQSKQQISPFCSSLVSNFPQIHKQLVVHKIRIQN